LPDTALRVLTMECVDEIFDRELATGAVTEVDVGIVSMNFVYRQEATYEGT
jgi:hypothetical protein